MYKEDKPKIISAAITGAVHTPSLSPYLPKTPDEIIESAVLAHEAGAAIVHIHARAEDGMPTGKRGIFRHILSAIKKECNAVISITTGGANGMSMEERFSVLEEFQPEMASANGGSMNFCYHRLLEEVEETIYPWEREYVERTWDNVFRNSFRDMEYCIRMMNRFGTLPEFEVFDYGQLNNLKLLKKGGVITQPIYLQFVPGVQGGMPAENEGLMFMIDQAKKMLGDGISYCSVGIGRKMFKMETMCAINGGNVRVGMEDGLYIDPTGKLAPSNAAQVSKIRGILEALDYKIADSEQCRKMICLKGKDKVRF